jgi:GGDEF domain-containing protein
MSRSLVQEYERAKAFRKAMLYVFFIVFVATVLWAIPWLPYGLSVGDYNDRTELLVALGLLASISAFGAVYMRDVSRRFEQTLLTWTTVHDGLSDLRRREYFYERVVIECQRAKASGSRFAVIALRFRRDENEASPEMLATALHAIEPHLGSNDRVAALASHEIGVLSFRVAAEPVRFLAKRLEDALAEAVAGGDESHISVGWAVYGVDGDDAGALVGMARTRLKDATAEVIAPAGGLHAA